MNSVGRVTASEAGGKPRAHSRPPGAAPSGKPSFFTETRLSTTANFLGSASGFLAPGDESSASKHVRTRAPADRRHSHCDEGSSLGFSVAEKCQNRVWA
jgi:hypothetical protein